MILTKQPLNLVILSQNTARRFARVCNRRTSSAHTGQRSRIVFCFVFIGSSAVRLSLIIPAFAKEQSREKVSITFRAASSSYPRP